MLIFFFLGIANRATNFSNNEAHDSLILCQLRDMIKIALEEKKRRRDAIYTKQTITYQQFLI